MRAAAAWAARRIGRRGAVLSLKGLMALLYGLSQLLGAPHDQLGIRLLLGLMPARCWAWAWITAGVVALVAAWLRQGRDWPGFAALFLIVAPWSLSYLASSWLYDNPKGLPVALIFAAFGGVAAVAAAWPEPPHYERRRNRGAL